MWLPYTGDVGCSGIATRASQKEKTNHIFIRSRSHGQKSPNSGNRIPAMAIVKYISITMTPYPPTLKGNQETFAFSSFTFVPLLPLYCFLLQLLLFWVLFFSRGGCLPPPVPFWHRWISALQSLLLLPDRSSSFDEDLEGTDAAWSWSLWNIIERSFGYQIPPPVTSLWLRRKPPRKEVVSVAELRRGEWK